MTSSKYRIEVKYNDEEKYQHGHYAGESAIEKEDLAVLRVLVHGKNVGWNFHRGFNEFLNFQDDLCTEFPRAGLDRYDLDYNDLPTLESFLESVLSAKVIAASKEVKVFLCLKTKEKQDVQSFPELTDPTQDVGGISSDQDNAQSSDKISDARLQLKDYQFITWLGNGGFGAVALVKRLHDSEALAMKIIVKDGPSGSKTKEHAKNEKTFLSQLDHPFIIKMICTFHTKAKLYIVLEFASGGDLFFHIHKIKNISVERVRFYGAEIVSALEYLHNENIVYRDLKPDNLLVGPDGHILLADFGLCKAYDPYKPQVPSSQCGTPEYFAPEILSETPCNHSVDWWAFGVILYEMSFGRNPFWDPKKRLQELSIARVTPAKVRDRKEKCDDLLDIISKLLKRNSNDRLGSNGASEVKNHAYFKETDWDKLYAKKINPPFIPTKWNLDNPESFPQVDPGASRFTDNTEAIVACDDDFRFFTSVGPYEKKKSQDAYSVLLNVLFFFLPLAIIDASTESI